MIRPYHNRQERPIGEKPLGLFCDVQDQVPAPAVITIDIGVAQVYEKLLFVNTRHRRTERSYDKGGLNNDAS